MTLVLGVSVSRRQGRPRCRTCGIELHYRKVDAGGDKRALLARRMADMELELFHHPGILARRRRIRGWWSTHPDDENNVASACCPSRFVVALEWAGSSRVLIGRIFSAN